MRSLGSLSLLRARQFLAGRRCAHQLLEGIAPVDQVLRRHDGAPVTENRFLNVSIAHAGDAVMAACVQGGNRSIGCDVVPKSTLLTGQIFPPGQFERFDLDPRQEFAIFESVYKAYLSATLPFRIERFEWSLEEERIFFRDLSIGVEGQVEFGWNDEVQAYFAVGSIRW